MNILNMLGKIGNTRPQQEVSPQYSPSQGGNNGSAGVNPYQAESADLSHLASAIIEGAKFDIYGIDQSHQASSAGNLPEANFQEIKGPKAPSDQPPVSSGLAKQAVSLAAAGEPSYAQTA